jgi:hypothetical protein
MVVSPSEHDLVTLVSWWNFHAILLKSNFPHKARPFFAELSAVGVQAL